MERSNLAQNQVTLYASSALFVLLQVCFPLAAFGRELSGSPDLTTMIRMHCEERLISPGKRAPKSATSSTDSDDILVTAVSYPDLRVERQFNTGYIIQHRDIRSQARLIYIHGSGQTYNSWRHFRSFVENGFKIFAIEFQGNTENGGQTTVDEIFEDVTAGIRYALNDLSELPTLIVAQSLGGAVAMRVLENEPINCGKSKVHGLILEGVPFDMTDSIVRQHFGHPIFAPVRPLMTRIVDKLVSPALSCQVTPKQELPTLLIHYEQDQIVPFDHSLRWRELIGPQATLLTRKGKKHLSGLTFKEYLSWVNGQLR